MTFDPADWTMTIEPVRTWALGAEFKRDYRNVRVITTADANEILTADDGRMLWVVAVSGHAWWVSKNEHGTQQHLDDWLETLNLRDVPWAYCQMMPPEGETA